MNLRHARRSRSLERNDRAMRASRELRSLTEQASVRQRDREIGTGFSLDNDAAIEAVIADGQVFQADVELVAFAGEPDQRGLSLGGIDQQFMTADIVAGRCEDVESDIRSSDRSCHREEGSAPDSPDRAPQPTRRRCIVASVRCQRSGAARLGDGVRLSSLSPVGAATRRHGETAIWRTSLLVFKGVGGDPLCTRRELAQGKHA